MTIPDAPENTSPITVIDRFKALLNRQPFLERARYFDGITTSLVYIINQSKFFELEFALFFGPIQVLKEGDDLEELIVSMNFDLINGLKANLRKRIDLEVWENVKLYLLRHSVDSGILNFALGQAFTGEGKTAVPVYLCRILAVVAVITFDNRDSLESITIFENQITCARNVLKIWMNENSELLKVSDNAERNLFLVHRGLELSSFYLNGLGKEKKTD